MNADKAVAIVVLGVVAGLAMWLGVDGAKDVALTVVGAIGGMTVSHALSSPPA